MDNPYDRLVQVGFNPLPDFHLLPINLVISEGSSVPMSFFRKLDTVPVEN